MGGRSIVGSWVGLGLILVERLLVATRVPGLLWRSKGGVVCGNASVLCRRCISSLDRCDLAQLDGRLCGDLVES